jgi:hypothetical protein
MIKIPHNPKMCTKLIYIAILTLTIKSASTTPSAEDKIQEKIKIGLHDPSLKPCYRIFEFFDTDELKEFINEQGLDKYEH